MTVFPLFYLPPISYFKEWVKHDTIRLEKHENFQKQTYRNRGCILGPNGRQKLIIPTVHDGNRLYRETQISHAENWGKEHVKSLEAAYRRSPYFEYYEDDLLPLWETREKYLYDFNLKILEQLLSILQLDTDFTLTENYQSEYPSDFRMCFNAKEAPQKTTQEYTQVFAEKHAFEPDLSILDLLFNLGPEAVLYLNQ